MILSENRQINELILIFVGKFNPAIISPYWLVYHKLIREEEGKNAKVEVIHNELVKFEIDWLKIQVSKDRFEFKSTQESYFEPLKDLAVSIFKILNQTPLESFGINHLRHYTLDTAKEYYEFGNKLAPLAPWKKTMKDPKVLSLELLDLKENGSRRVRIQPSDSLKNTQNAFMININDHFETDLPNPQKNDKLISFLIESWASSFAFADEIESHIEGVLKS